MCEHHDVCLLKHFTHTFPFSCYQTPENSLGERDQNFKGSNFLVDEWHWMSGWFEMKHTYGTDRTGAWIQVTCAKTELHWSERDRNRWDMNSDALDILQWKCVGVRQTHALFRTLNVRKASRYARRHLALYFLSFVVMLCVSLLDCISRHTHTHTCCPSQLFCSVIGGEPRGRASFSECLWLIGRRASRWTLRGEWRSR